MQSARWIAAVVCGAAACWLGGEAGATTLLQAGMPELWERAAVVVEADVASVEGVTLGVAPHIFTAARLEGATFYKGKEAAGGGAAVQVLLPGGASGRGRLVIEGMPTLKAGTRVVVFLEPLPASVSPDGAPRFTILGMWQGVLTQTPGGEAFVREPQGGALVAPGQVCTGGEEVMRFDAAALRSWLREEATR